MSFDRLRTNGKWMIPLVMWLMTFVARLIPFVVQIIPFVVRMGPFVVRLTNHGRNGRVRRFPNRLTRMTTVTIKPWAAGQ